MQLYNEYKSFIAANYLNRADGMRVLFVDSMKVLCKNDDEFLSKIKNLDPGFYGINFETDQSGHSISLNILINDWEIVDPNGHVLSFDKKVGEARLKIVLEAALKELIQLYPPPNEKKQLLPSGLTQNPQNTVNHRISILRYEAIADFKPIVVDLANERRKRQERETLKIKSEKIKEKYRNNTGRGEGLLLNK